MPIATAVRHAFNAMLRTAGVRQHSIMHGIFDLTGSTDRTVWHVTVTIITGNTPVTAVTNIHQAISRRNIWKKGSEIIRIARPVIAAVMKTTRNVPSGPGGTMSVHGSALKAVTPSGVKYIGNQDIIIINVMMTMIVIKTMTGGISMMMTEPLCVCPAGGEE